MIRCGRGWSRVPPVVVVLVTPLTAVTPLRAGVGHGREEDGQVEVGVVARGRCSPVRARRRCSTTLRVAERHAGDAVDQAQARHQPRDVVLVGGAAGQLERRRGDVGAQRACRRRRRRTVGCRGRPCRLID